MGFHLKNTRRTSRLCLAVIFVFISTGMHSCKKESITLAVRNKAGDLPLPCPDSMLDADGNKYTVLDAFGTCWLKENLRSSHFQNGDSIPEIITNTDWIAQTAAAVCTYQNNVQYDSLFGKLYNGYAVADPRNVCPAGWHVSTDAEWSGLIDSLGGEGIAAGPLKALEWWSMPNAGATNEIGFGALPGGLRDADHGGFFGSLNNSGYWWSSSLESAPGAFVRYMNYPNVNVNRLAFSKKNGFSVRCVRN
jgi:uncharacterized protein (TIGR02145 family)